MGPLPLLWLGKLETPALWRATTCRVAIQVHRDLHYTKMSRKPYYGCSKMRASYGRKGFSVVGIEQTHSLLFLQHWKALR